MTDNAFINLLVVDRSASDIDHILDTLRTGGYLVQLLNSQQSAEIHDCILYKPLDLIMVRQSENLPEIKEIRAQVIASSQDIPILAIVDDPQKQNPVDLLRAGADNFFYLAEPDHLLLAVRKEIHHLRIRHMSRSQEVKLKESEERCHALLESFPHAIAYIHEGAHIYANPVYLKLFGYPDKQDLEGITLMNLVSPGDRDKLKGFLRQSTKSGRSLDPIELDGLDREGKPFPIQMDCVLTHMDEEPCLQICIRHPAQVQGDEQRSEKFGERDELTGLYSRKFLTQYLNQVCAASSEEAGAVLYILLNDHRAISEQLGLEAADQLVVDLAKRLQGLVSEKEIIARFSDAVFVIYTPESSGKALLQLGERLCAEIKSYVTNAARKLVSTSCSIGICMIQKSHENATQVLSQVDRVCEIARQMGDNQVQIYPPLDAKPNQPQPEEKVSGLIRNAIDGERITLLYGPIASFQDNVTERYKVYLRILGEDKKPLPMGTFGPVAESRGLMGSLDRWAIARGLKTISKRSKKVGKSTTLFIRISQNSVTDEDFHDWLGKLLKETGLGAEVLVIEVAEQCAEKCLMETKRLREQVQRLGGGFALSHLSGRPNSERVLNYLSPDYIKLDGALIEKLSKNKDEEGRKVVAKLTEQAQAKKIKVVAANVSTAPQMASIWQFGVTLVQGDMVQEPSPEMNFDFSQFTG